MEATRKTFCSVKKIYEIKFMLLCDNKFDYITVRHQPPRDHQVKWKIKSVMNSFCRAYIYLWIRAYALMGIEAGRQIYIFYYYTFSAPPMTSVWEWVIAMCVCITAAVAWWIWFIKMWVYMSGYLIIFNVINDMFLAICFKFLYETIKSNNLSLKN